MTAQPQPNHGGPTSVARPSPLTDVALSAALEEIHFLDGEIRNLIRNSAQLVASAFALGALGVTLSKDVSPNLSLGVLPILLTGLAVYSINVSTDVAALAEQRDRLSAWFNRSLQQQVLVTRLISDVRRGSRGTAAAYSLSTFIVIASIVAGLVNASPQGGLLLVYQWLVSVLCVAAIGFAFADFLVVRGRVNEALDIILGAGDRPRSAPTGEERGWRRIITAIRVRREP